MVLLMHQTIGTKKKRKPFLASLNRLKQLRYSRNHKQFTHLQQEKLIFVLSFLKLDNQGMCFVTVDS